MSVVEELRAEIQAEVTTGLFGRKKYPKHKDGALLYLFARVRDARDEAKHWQEVARHYRRAFTSHAMKYNDIDEINRVEQAAPHPITRENTND